MQEIKASSGYVAIELSKEELLLVYGCIVEAMAALSAAEFRARVGGIDEERAAELARELKPLFRETET